MDLGILGTITLDWTFLSGLLSVIAINIILSGDNAVLIAMAVRSLPRARRRQAILFGAGAAIVLRILLTFVVAHLMSVPFVKLVGGALILWIAIQLFLDANPEDDSVHEAANMWQALKIILIADITMSLDNMLGVAGASHGNVFLLVFGLGTSIPIIIFTSSLLTMLMDKYPIIIYIGAALLGKVGGEMIITDPAVHGWLAPGMFLEYSVQVFCAAGVIIAGKLIVRSR